MSLSCCGWSWGSCCCWCWCCWLVWWSSWFRSICSACWNTEGTSPKCDEGEEEEESWEGGISLGIIISGSANSLKLKTWRFQRSGPIWAYCDFQTHFWQIRYPNITMKMYALILELIIYLFIIGYNCIRFYIYMHLICVLIIEMHFLYPCIPVSTCIHIYPWIITILILSMFSVNFGDQRSGEERRKIAKSLENSEKFLISLNLFDLSSDMVLVCRG